MCHNCPVGTYQDITPNNNGISSCKSCPAGTYGDSEGLTSSACSGLCSKGHFCPSQSSSSTANKCPGNTFFPFYNRLKQLLIYK